MRELLAREAERLVAGAAGAHGPGVSERFGFDAPDDAGGGVGLEQRCAEMVGEGEAG
jgi:hypothetical protein